MLWNFWTPPIETIINNYYFSFFSLMIYLISNFWTHCFHFFWLATWGWINGKMTRLKGDLNLFIVVKKVTQSKSKTIITWSMLTISLIVFTDKLQGHVHTIQLTLYQQPHICFTSTKVQGIVDTKGLPSKCYYQMSIQIRYNTTTPHQFGLFLLSCQTT